MRHPFAAVAPLAALSFVLATAAPVAADLPQLKARGTLRVIVAAQEAPETFGPHGGGGFERELVDTFARANRLELEVVVAKSHPERIDLLLADRGDMIVAIFDTPDRRQRVAFTAEVMPTYNVAVTLAPRPPITTVADLRRENVGVLRGTATAEELAGASTAPLQRFDSKQSMLAALATGGVGALVMPISELALAMKAQPALQRGVQVGASASVAWAVRKEDAELLAALDRHLEYVRKSASWNLLLVKYFGEQAPLVLGRQR